VDFDTTDAQSGGHLKPDEACPDYQSRFLRSRAVYDLAAVRQRTQRQYIRLVGAGNPKAYRLSAGRQEQPIVGNTFPRGDSQLVRANIQRCDFRTQPQVDRVV
jgi:hypothetical protein